MMITGSVKCKYCGKQIDWFYVNLNKMTVPLFDVVTLPTDRVSLHSRPYKTGEKTYTLSCYCECGTLNEFDYESNVELH